MTSHTSNKSAVFLGSMQRENLVDAFLMPIRHGILGRGFASIGEILAEKGCAADQVISGDEPPHSVVHGIGLV